MARLLLLWFVLSGCPSSEKPRLPQPAVEETPAVQDTPTAKKTPFAIRTPAEKKPPPEPITTTEPEAPTEPEVPVEVIAEDIDPRHGAEIDPAVLPSVWVYFSRDDQHGYRSVFLFAHREKVSDLKVSYATPFLIEFEDSGYSDMDTEEKKIFVKQELQLQLSFLFETKQYCGNVAIKQDNIVPAGIEMDKDKSLKIELKSGSC